MDTLSIFFFIMDDGCIMHEEHFDRIEYFQYFFLKQMSYMQERRFNYVGYFEYVFLLK